MISLRTSPPAAAAHTRSPLHAPVDGYALLGGLPHRGAMLQTRKEPGSSKDLSQEPKAQ